MTSTESRFPCVADPDRMFPDDEAEHGPPSDGEWNALAVCARCPSLAPCRSWALTSRTPHGVVGGTTRAQRLSRPASHGAPTTRLHDVLGRQQEVTQGADAFVVEELVAGTLGMRAQRWEVALAAIVLIEAGRPKLQICRQLRIHPRQLYRWWHRYLARQPIVPAQVSREGAS